MFSMEKFLAIDPRVMEHVARFAASRPCEVLVGQAWSQDGDGAHRTVLRVIEVGGRHAIHVPVFDLSGEPLQRVLARVATERLARSLCDSASREQIASGGWRP
jgi:hypothetical protein